METKKKAKSDKLYGDSPSIKKDGDGKPGISKPSKADAEDMGTEGNLLEGAGDGVPVDPHQAERAEMAKKHGEEMKSMHGRHQEEHADMHKRHQKEHQAMTERHSAGDGGKQEISKVEGTK